jgi:hypothetical protein
MRELTVRASESRVRESAPVMSDLNALLARFLPTGASAATARQDGLSAGISASHRMARADLPRLRKHLAAFESAGLKHGLPPALLAAIASRESRAGATLDASGLGRGGECFGLMQLDSRYFTPRGGAYTTEHIHQVAQVLEGLLGEVKARHPGWPAEQQLRGVLVAYDSGVGHVRTIKDMDRGTTGGDYSNDVWARAQALASAFGDAGDSLDRVVGRAPATGPFAS